MTDVIAHRGASRLERENTIAAFHRAVALGTDGIELDVRRCGDGTLVVHHDAVLADGRPIVGVGVAELPAYVPVLSAALDACAGVGVNLELKNVQGEPDFDPTDELADRVAELLAARPEPAETWLVSSFRIQTIDRFLAIAPALATAFLTVMTTDEIVDEVVGRGHVAVHPWVETLTEAAVARCRDRGLQVNAWTCNEPDQARRLAGWGVDGIVTDVPDVMLRALGRPKPT